MSTTTRLLPTGRCLLCALVITSPALAADSTSEVRNHADRTFLQMHTGEQALAPEQQNRPQPPAAQAYDVDRFLIGQGQGDLSKGPLVCQRVSELSARADIAKQIRVQVKEHAIDRLRERSGREPEQDIEVVREEIVQEYLQGVTIVERRKDEASNTCSAVAVMPKRTLATPHAIEPMTADSPAHR